MWRDRIKKKLSVLRLAYVFDEHYNCKNLKLNKFSSTLNCNKLVIVRPYTRNRIVLIQKINLITLFYLVILLCFASFTSVKLYYYKDITKLQFHSTMVYCLSCFVTSVTHCSFQRTDFSPRFRIQVTLAVSATGSFRLEHVAWVRSSVLRMSNYLLLLGLLQHMYFFRYLQLDISTTSVNSIFCTWDYEGFFSLKNFSVISSCVIFLVCISGLWEDI